MKLRVRTGDGQAAIFCKEHASGLGELIFGLLSILGRLQLQGKDVFGMSIGIRTCRSEVMMFVDSFPAKRAVSIRTVEGFL